MMRCVTAFRAAGIGRSREDYVLRRKKMRSAVLKRIQQLGVDTTDFDKVNAFLPEQQDSRKAFRDADD